MRAFLTSEAVKKTLLKEITLGLKRGCNGLFLRLAGSKRGAGPEAWEGPRLRGAIEDDLLDIQVSPKEACVYAMYTSERRHTNSPELVDCAIYRTSFALCRTCWTPVSARSASRWPSTSSSSFSRPCSSPPCSPPRKT